MKQLFLCIKRRFWVWLLLIFLMIMGIGWSLYLILANRVIEPQPVPEKSPILYGEFIPWEQVKQVFPQYAQCTVRDFETGKQFNVVRRAGSSHADVQPLTAQDTEIMKSIYGQWSWRRRAVLVELADGRVLAGSMNGMPHGAGAVKGNNFNGHFCIHFRDSKTHSSSRVDKAHQAMVWKAAGLLDEQLSALPAREIVDVFFNILDQGDQELIQALLIDEGDLYQIKNLTGIEYCVLRSIEAQDETTFIVKLRIRRMGVKAEQDLTLYPELVQHPYWKIKMESLAPLYQNFSRQTLARFCLPYITRPPLCAVQFFANRCTPYYPV